MKQHHWGPQRVAPRPYGVNARARLCQRVLVAVTLAMSASASAAFQFEPLGGNVLVNASAAGNQSSPAISVDAVGNSVVAWFSQTGDSNQGVYAQRFDATGTATGPEFRVDDAHTTVNGSVGVAMAAAGSFVIVWYSGQDLGVPADAPGTGRSFGIFGKRYDATGTELTPPAGVQGAGVGNEFQVNTTANGRQLAPRVAMSAAGDFIVVWEDQGLPGSFDSPDGSGFGVYAQRFDATGNRVGIELQVNSFSTDSQAQPVVAMTEVGAFVVSWASDGQDGGSRGVFAKRYDASGNEVSPAAGTQGSGVGNEFQVNSFTSGDQFGPRVAAHPTGNSMFFAWTDTGQGPGASSTYAKRYDASGGELMPPAPLWGTGSGNEFRVNDYVSSFQDASSVGLDGEGNAVVSWISEGQDGDTNGVFAKVYDAAGNEVNPGFAQGAGIGTEFQVSETAAAQQSRSAVAMNASGDFVIVWEDEVRDGNGAGVFYQQYRRLTAARLLESIIVDVVTLNLIGGLANSLDAKLDTALHALQDANLNNDVAACNSVNAFVNSVEAQSGNKISVADANGLIASAEEVLALLGCQ